MSVDTHHDDSQSFGSSPNYNTAHYTTLGPMSTSDEMPPLVSSREDEEGGEVNPRTKHSDAGSEGSEEKPLRVALKIKVEQVIHPCVDCGRLTEWFCDWRRRRAVFRPRDGDQGR